MRLPWSRFSTHAPIAARMTVIVLIPCLIIAALVVGQIVERIAAARTVSNVGAVTRFSVDIGNLVHELQKERGMSAVFINSKGAQMAAELPPQHRLGTERLQAMLALGDRLDRRSYTAPIAQALDDALTAVKALPAWREQVLARRVAGLESNQFYARLIATLLAVPQVLVQAAPDAETSAEILAYSNFLAGKEQAGQERAGGALGFAAGRFDVGQYRALVTAGAEQAVMLHGFRRFATPEQIAFFDQTVSGPVVTTYDRSLQQALTAGPGGDLGGITGADWYHATTNRINLMKPVEDRVAADLIGMMEGRASEARMTTITRIAVMTLAMLASIGLAVWLTRGVVRPIRAMTLYMRRLADDDLTGEVPGLRHGDEIGLMARAVQVFKENRIAAKALEADQDAIHEAKRQEADRLDALTGTFDTQATTLLGRVSAAAAAMRTTAVAMTQAADQATRRTSEVADAAEQASANVQAVSAATEELSSSIAEITRQVAQSAEVAGQAVEDVRNTDTVVRDLDEGAQRIGEVVSLISSIAGQTNLLALNATIEAARAGDAGKGFAVVASEVKNLAAQTARATEDISRQVERIQATTRGAVDAIQGIGARIATVSEVASSIAAAVEEQGAATQEIARNVQQAAEGTRAVTTTIAEVSADAAMIGGSAAKVNESAVDLSTQAEQLGGQVSSFLNQVKRAA